MASNGADVSDMWLRGEKIPEQSPENGYDQNWYPICLAHEVGEGSIYGTEFMNGRVIVVRDGTGNPQVLSSYCRHLGADLADGEILDGTVRCPFHHWRYDTTGQCVATALDDEAPRQAKLFRFPTVETLGFIWAFNGTKPLYDPPHFPLPESELVMKTEFNIITEQDHFVPLSNSSDIQHLRAVHGIDLTVDPADVTITQTGLHYFQTMNIPGIGEMKQEVTVFGTNCLIFVSQFEGRPVYQMSGIKALNGHRCLANMIVATPRGDGSAADEAAIEGALQQALAFGNKLFEEDELIQTHLRFRQDILTRSDRMLVNYLRYVREFPRTSIACDMIA